MKKPARPPLSLLDRYYGEEYLPLYATTVRVTGGETAHGRASGVVESDDGKLKLDLRLPEAMGGPGGGTNPEQLFAAGFAACFHGALTLLASRAKVPIPDAAIDATVSFGRDPMDGLYMLTADIRIHLPGVPRATAEELIRNAERLCPYTKMAQQGIRSIIHLI